MHGDKSMKQLLIHLLLVLLWTTFVSGVDVTCYTGPQCDGVAAAVNVTYEACCGSTGLGTSYAITEGLCCQCGSDTQVDFSAAEYTVSEDDSFITLTILRCGPFEEDLALSLTLSDVTATGGVDYGPFPSSQLQLTTVVPANSSETIFGVNIREDAVVEDTETFSVTLRGFEGGFDPFGGGAGEGALTEPLARADVSILDDDFVFVTIEPRSFSVVESAGNVVNFTVTLNGMTERNISVVASTQSGGNNTISPDYIELDRVLTFSPGVTRLNLQFEVLDDDIVEATEPVQLVLGTSGSERAVQFPLGGGGGVASGEILDDNDSLTISFDRPVYSVDEQTGVARIRLRKEGVNERDVSVRVRLDEANSVAMEGLDFNLTDPTTVLTFSPGTDTLDYTFLVLRDDLFEDDEVLSFQLEPAAGETAVVVTGPTQVVILDSDVVIVGFAEERYTALESGLALNISAVLIEGNLDVGVELSVQVLPLAANLATEGVDFELPTTTITFDPGAPPSSELYFQMQLLDDPVFEGREDVTLVLRTAQARVLFSPETTVVSIADNEDLVVQFQNETYSVVESDSSLEVVVVLMSLIERDITLDFTTVDGKAVAGADYEAQTTMLTFAPNSDRQEVRLTLLDDLRSEGAEEFSLHMVLVDESLGVPGVVAQATVLISDDENIFVSFSNASFSVREGDNVVILRITKTGETEDDVDVVVGLRDGSARGGIDYGPFPTPELNISTSILAGETEAEFGVFVRDDGLIERLESFGASLYVPEQESGGNVFLGSVSTAEVFIVDNDAINITILPTTLTVDENAGFALVEISRTDDYTIVDGLDIVINVTTVSDSAQGGEDYVDSFASLMFSDDRPDNYILNITILEDRVAEAGENFTVSLVVPDALSQHVIFASGAEASIQIIDNDVVMVSFESSLFEVSESEAVAMVCLQKDRDTSQPLTVVVQPFETQSTDPDVFEAKAGTDFNATAVTKSFGTGEREICVEIPVLDDQLEGETREVFAVSFSVVDADFNVEVGQLQTATVMISDVPDINFGFVTASAEVGESIGTVDVCVQIFNPAAGEVFNSTLTVQLQVSPVTADTTDFITSDSTTLTLSDDVRRACLEIQIIDDEQFEDYTETLSISIANFSLSNLILTGFPSVDQTSLTITDDDRDLVLGFLSDSLVVSEAGGNVNVCVSVLEPGPELGFDSEVGVIVGTRPGTAGSQDFVSISALQQDLILRFSTTSRLLCFLVEIINDGISEGTTPETFSVQLTVQARQSSNDLQGVRAEPSSLTVSIVDNERRIFLRFLQTRVEVVQEDREVELCVGVDLRPDEVTEVEFAIMVLLFEELSTAEFRRDFDLDLDQVLFFNNSRREQCFEVSIFSSQEFEADVPKRITLGLSLTDLEGVGFAENASTAVIVLLEGADNVTTDMPPTTEAPVLANDTILGSPLYSVPFALPPEFFTILPRRAQGSTPHLCFQINGDPDTHFNLISDTCTSVNARYSAVQTTQPLPFPLNALTRIGISTVNAVGQCVFIDVGLDNGCVPIVQIADSAPTEVTQYSSEGVSVTQRQTHVRVSVPNCGQQKLVMYITCRDGMVGGISTPLVQFDVTRGVNLSPTSHGLLGQFWNVPVEIQPYQYDGPTPTFLHVDSLYAVTVSHPQSTRRFVAEYFPFKWDSSRGSCFYSGNLHGGHLLEISDPSFNDPVIEGQYTDYIVPGLFQNDFQYSQFSDCSLS